MSVDSVPHATWDSVYDLAYERSFGAFYAGLTEATIGVISDRINPPSSIIDFGAGTGRFSLPLADMGYRVTAVDACPEMLDELASKAGNTEVKRCLARMEDFTSKETFDAALCVFTVILYMLTQECLDRALRAAHTSLKPGGLFLIDVPSEDLFQSYTKSDEQLSRTVSIEPIGNHLYRDVESSEVHSNQGVGPKRYEDEFTIRHWQSELVMEIAAGVGFSIESDLTENFEGAGLKYYALRKQ
jgi:SAM-dependent methyltransferase